MRYVVQLAILLTLLSGCGMQVSFGGPGGAGRVRASSDLAWDERLWAGDEFRVSANGYDAPIRRLRVSVDGYVIWDEYYASYYVREYLTMPYYVYGDVMVAVEAWDDRSGYGTDYVRVYVLP